MRITIEAASRDQLKHFCTLQGLEFDGRSGDNKLRALIVQSGYERDWIEVPDDLAAAEIVEVAADEPERANQPKMVELTISVQTGETGDVTLGHDGKIMRVPRGRRVKIPYRYYQVLEDAVQFVYEETARGADLSEHALRDPIPVYSYPFTVHRFID